MSTRRLSIHCQRRTNADDERLNADVLATILVCHKKGKYRVPIPTLNASSIPDRAYNYTIHLYSSSSLFA